MGKSETIPYPGLIELLDKEQQMSMLLSAIKRDRLGGTLLFFGPESSGKSSLAFWLAATLNCTGGNSSDGPCMECSSCRKIGNLSHPDVFWVFPLPGNYYKSGQVDEMALAEAFETKRCSPWLDIQFAEKSEHHLAAVHRIRKEASRSCYEARKKVFVITGADRLRLEAANAFLKLLEEPREDMVFILCSERPNSLPATILSRCQRMHVTRPRRSTLVSLLKLHFSLSENEASQLLALSDYNLSEALRNKDEDSFQARQEWVSSTFEAVLAGSTESCFNLLDNRKGPMYKRGDFERYLGFLAQALRQALLVRLGREKSIDSEDETCVNEKIMQDYASRVADFQGLIKLIIRTVDLSNELNRNVNLRLLGWSVLNNMREVIGDGVRYN